MLDIIHRPAFYLKLSLPLYLIRNTSPLRAQQVNAIYRFVTIIY
jgi:hypothetical protein